MTRLGKKQKRMLQRASIADIKPQLADEIDVALRLADRGLLERIENKYRTTEAGFAALAQAPGRES